MRLSGRHLCAVTGLVYLPAWFLPAAHNSGELFRGDSEGWRAFVFAISPLFGNDLGGSLPLLLWMVTSALSNLLLVAALVLVCWRPRAVGRRLVWSLAAATAVNAYWYWLPEMRPDLRIGYYLWVCSFALGTMAASFTVREQSATTALVARP